MSKSVDSPNIADLGRERLQSDKRQRAGLLMMQGAAALVYPLANIATLVGPNGTTANMGLPVSSLISSVLVVVMGIQGMVLGYLGLVHDVGHKYLTGFLAVFIQLAWMSYLTDLTTVGRGARSGMAFISPGYHPTASDVRFVGAMGMIGIIAYGLGFLGSLAFYAFDLYTFQSGKPEKRPGGYYRGRLGFYCFAFFLAGISQFLLGVHIINKLSSGPLVKGPIAVAMYFVSFPEISVAVGLLQMIVATYGMARAYLHFADGPDNHSFQFAALILWICVVSMQILTQFAYAPGGMAAAGAPSVTMLTLGLHVLPAYLDYKMRTVPETISASYYGLGPVAAEDVMAQDNTESEGGEKVMTGDSKV